MLKPLPGLFDGVSCIWINETDVSRGASKEKGKSFGSCQEWTHLVGFDVNFGEIHEEGLRNEIKIIYFLGYLITNTSLFY